MVRLIKTLVWLPKEMLSDMKELVKSLDEVKSIAELTSFLESKGENHRNYYHYTNKTGLIGMLKSRKLHLSRGDQMNDKQELTKGDIQTWEKIYLASFNYGEEENMAMWGLYGVPHEDAIRITIPGKMIREWINSVKRIYSVESNSLGEFSYLEIPEFERIKLTDVIYVTGKRYDVTDFSLRRSRDRIVVKRDGSLAYVSDSTAMTGYIKNAAWSYENEVRIRVETREDDCGNKVAIDIPDEVIKSFELLFGPGYQGDEQYRSNGFESVDSYSSKNNNVRNGILKHEYSVFKNLVNYREKCWFCENDYKRKD